VPRFQEKRRERWPFDDELRRLLAAMRSRMAESATVRPDRKGGIFLAVGRMRRFLSSISYRAEMQAATDASAETKSR
jgi:hypothetical protein